MDIGTLEDPILVNGAGDEQYAGCTGYPADSHIVNWLTVSLSFTSFNTAIIANNKKRSPVSAPSSVASSAATSSSSTTSVLRPMPMPVSTFQFNTLSSNANDTWCRRRPRPRPPRPLRGAQDLRRLRQARILVPINYHPIYLRQTFFISFEMVFFIGLEVALNISRY